MHAYAWAFKSYSQFKLIYFTAFTGFDCARCNLKLLTTAQAVFMRDDFFSAEVSLNLRNMMIYIDILINLSKILKNIASIVSTGIIIINCVSGCFMLIFCTWTNIAECCNSVLYMHLSMPIKCH